MANTSVSVNLDHAALADIAADAQDEIARTLGFELLRRSNVKIQEKRAIDTGNMRGSGHVLLHGQTPKQPEIPAAEPGEAVVAYGAEYSRAVHDGLGSNRQIGPRPFLYEAAEDLQIDAQAIAEDIAKRRYG